MKKITVSILGLGGRGRVTYGEIIRNSSSFEVVAAADLNAEKLEEAKKTFSLPDSRCFHSDTEMLACEKLSDMMIIATMDRDHVREALEALDKGYDLLLEKPISLDIGECEQLLAKAEQCGRKVCVCHVLRYTPFYGEIKRQLDCGAVGRIMSVQAREDVGYYHQAHSFVRGNWRSSEESSPMILQKCCHDMDLFVWLTGAECRTVSSFGSLDWFKAENAPEGAAPRCMSGCRAKDGCPFDCEKIYITSEATGIRGGNTWPADAVVMEPTEEKLRKALSSDSPYGRCVYHCDNDVVDHQQVNMLMEGGITVSLSMCAFTASIKRTVKIMGTEGEIEADMEKNVIRLTRFGEKTQVIDVNQLADDFSGHGGGDARMLEEFGEYIRTGVRPAGMTDLSASIESHRMAMAAEESRLRGGAPVQIRHSGAE